MRDSRYLLVYLESCRKTRSWAAYIRRNATYVQEHVQALREFASLKPGNVADVCNKRANEIETRLTRLLDSLPNYQSGPTCWDWGSPVLASSATTKLSIA